MSTDRLGPRRPRELEAPPESAGSPARCAERPPLRRRTGATRFAVICAEELEALATLGGESGAALQVLAWLKCNLRRKTPYVEMPDVEIADRSGKSRNTVRAGIAALLRVGLIFDSTPGARRRGVHPEYEVAFPPQRIKAVPTWSDSEHVESEILPPEASSSEHYERKNWTRQAQGLNTRSPSREYGTEKSALRSAQQARSSVGKGSSLALVSGPGCEECTGDDMLRPGFRLGPGGAYRCKCNPAMQSAAGEGS